MMRKYDSVAKSWCSPATNGEKQSKENIFRVILHYDIPGRSEVTNPSNINQWQNSSKSCNIPVIGPVARFYNLWW